MGAMKARKPTGLRKAPKQERSKATVEALLQATAQVLTREGYEGASTNRIAEVSGYGIGSLYEYFPNKESLVATLIERHAEEMLALFETWARSHADSPLLIAMRALVEASIAAHAVEPELHKVLVEQVPRVGDLERIGGIEERIARLLRGYLERHAEEVRPGDLSLAAFVVARAVESLGHEAVLGRPESLKDGRLAEEITALVLGYLAPEILASDSRTPL